NSDSLEDQWVKKQLQNAIEEHVSRWAGQMNQLEDARHLIEQKLPGIEQLTRQVLKETNTVYGFDVELGSIPFPAKMYGNQLYPAGKYESLLITLGAGEGQNWWCVLFPPL